MSGSMPAAKGEDAWATYNHNYELPSKVRVCVGSFVHLRWGVPLDEHNTRMWTFTLCKTPRTFLGRFWQDVWYYFWRKPAAVDSNQRKRGPGGVQEGAAEPRLTAEAVGAGHWGDQVPQPPGAKVSGFPYGWAGRWGAKSNHLTRSLTGIRMGLPSSHSRLSAENT